MTADRQDIVELVASDLLRRVLMLYENQYLVASKDGKGRVTHTMELIRAALADRPAP
jgi:hypothetical protein